MLKTSDFNYNLPQELIAQKPASPRDRSRLMVLNKKNKNIKHDIFYNITNYLRSGDVLVFNNSKVIKARLFGNLSPKEKNKNIEIFLLKNIKNNKWQVLAKPGKKLKAGNKIYFSPTFYAKSLWHYDEQTFLVEFNLSSKNFWNAIEKYGHIPIPPYIKNEPKKFSKYQTVYAKKEGSVAAPTAGLHFTGRLFSKIKKKGVQIEYITLHVGLGTFAPVKIDDLTKHKMHSEYAFVDKTTANKINKAKKEGRRIIAVGTTAARVLESATTKSPLISKEGLGMVASINKTTNIFIYPPYKFKIVDAMITNFHLPQSTLLMMISALAGKDFIIKAYDEAIKNNYRFFSFGDAMFIE